MAVADRERINVIFPKNVLEELRRRVPRKHRSELIVQATAEKLAMLRQREAVENAAGAWKDEDHPDLQTEEDVNRFIDELRGRRRTPQITEPRQPKQNVPA